MLQQRVAVIDLGTNTFHLLIAETTKQGFQKLYSDKVPVKIGEGGISEGMITNEAQTRALAAIDKINDILQQYKVPESKIWVVATSAFRSAKNGQALADTIEERTGFKVDIIDGSKEAEYIYFGAKTALDIGDTTSLIMDIGGGSVEFIIANQKRIFWKQSFEIGGQRLLDQFMRTDPITELDIQRMNIFLEEKLWGMSEVVFNYSPKMLIGCSGTFDTLTEINDARYPKGQSTRLSKTESEMDLDDFHEVYQALVWKGRSERLKVKGMVEMRADMIVVAVCLIRFIMDRYDLEHIRMSSYSLKEGLLSKMLGEMMD
ncbi:exopolyphosphatase, putative [Microscilla marina ATCC 23134]|uniref:Exopolyphosphatase, putative n=2 Tax=Microscilla marina TaxID=1027 RepID=A1ZUE9_MICM2|nr:exopolyphosphatase, putative [Microscilla marina ATCC 23134]